MKHPQISWVLNDEGSIEMDPDTYVKYKSLFDAETGEDFFTYLETGEGSFNWDWCGLIIDDLIEMCFLPQNSLIPFEEISLILNQKIRDQKISQLI